MKYGLTKSFRRAGEVLIKIIWLEKRLVDAIILRENPNLKDDFNNGVISEKHSELKGFWYKKSFPTVAKKFLEVFPEIEKKDLTHKYNLLGLGKIRDIISHGHISLHRDTIFFVADSKRRLEDLDSIIRPVIKVEKDIGVRTLDLSDEKAFDVIKSHIADTELILEKIFINYKVNPEEMW